MKILTITTCPTNKIVQKIELEMSGGEPIWFGYIYFNGEAHCLLIDDKGKFRIEKVK